MAIFPCAVGSHRYRGRASHAYPALVFASGATNRHHARLCQEHMSKLEDVAAPYLAAVAEETVPPSPRGALCMGCERAVERTSKQFFMTTYPGSQERQDYWGQIHEDCNPPMWLEQLLNNADRKEPPRPGDFRPSTL